MYTVVATVKSIKDHCAFHQLGDQIVYRGRTLEGSFCPSTMVGLFPTLFAVRYGAQFPWFDTEDSFDYACVDPDNPVTFEIKRIKEG